MRTRWVFLKRQGVVFACRGILVLLAALLGCSSAMNWVPDSSSPASCIPDRPLTWDDFSKRPSVDKGAAATAVAFRLLQAQPAHLQVQMNHEESWVRPELVNSWNPFMWSHSSRVLRHEQTHFAISCLLTRQANAVLEKGENAQAMLSLLRATAIRLNVQYDTETNHGENVWKQAEWERAVQAQLIAGPLSNMGNFQNRRDALSLGRQQACVEWPSAREPIRLRLCLFG